MRQEIHNAVRCAVHVEFIAQDLNEPCSEVSVAEGNVIWHSRTDDQEIFFDRRVVKLIVDAIITWWRDASADVESIEKSKRWSVNRVISAVEASLHRHGVSNIFLDPTASLNEEQPRLSLQRRAFVVGE